MSQLKIIMGCIVTMSLVACLMPRSGYRFPLELKPEYVGGQNKLSVEKLSFECYGKGSASIEGGECDWMWGQGAAWIADNGLMKIQTSSQHHFDTHNSEWQKPAFTMTRIPLGKGKERIAVRAVCKHEENTGLRPCKNELGPRVGYMWPKPHEGIDAKDKRFEGEPRTRCMNGSQEFLANYISCGLVFDEQVTALKKAITTPQDGETVGSKS